MSHNFTERSFPFPLFELAVLHLLQHAESREDGGEGRPARGRLAAGPMRLAGPWPWPAVAMLSLAWPAAGPAVAWRRAGDTGGQEALREVGKEEGDGN